MKISDNILEYICTSRKVNEMFLDFDNNRSYFNEGSFEDYVSNLKGKIISLFEKEISANHCSMQKDRIVCVSKLYDLMYKGNVDILNDRIFNTMRNYIDNINILVIEKMGSFSLENESIRNNALKIADIHVKEVEKFFKKYDYENRILKHLEKYDKYIIDSNKMSKEEFEEFDKILSNIGIDNPKKYVDLYFRELISNKYRTSFDTIYNVTRSMVGVISKSKSIDVLFSCSDLKYDLGAYHNGIITLSDNVLGDFVTSPSRNYNKYFITLFHEFTHLVQDTNFRVDRIFAYNEIKMLEDTILASLLSTKFYRKNYKNMSFELDARSFARVITNRYLSSIGINKDNKALIKDIKDRQKHSTDLRRVEVVGGTDNKLVPVDYIFDELMPHIIKFYKEELNEDLFKTYPILELLYDVDGRRFTTLELLKKKENIKKRFYKTSNEEKDTNDLININEIINNKRLSFINLVADFKELVLDEELPLEDKRDIIESLYRKIKSKEINVDLKNQYLYGEASTAKSVDEYIANIINTGNEMADYFYELLNKENHVLKNAPKEKANH